MAKKILFLDDDKNRHRAVKPHLLHDEAYTAPQAIELLQKHQYEIVFLDHDLGGRIMVESEGPEETGYTVAKWIAAHLPIIPLVVVHSLNPAGRENIACLLENHGYKVLRRGFLELKTTINEFTD